MAQQQQQNAQLGLELKVARQQRRWQQRAAAAVVAAAGVAWRRWQQRRRQSQEQWCPQRRAGVLHSSSTLLLTWSPRRRAGVRSCWRGRSRSSCAATNCQQASRVRGAQQHAQPAPTMRSLPLTLTAAAAAAAPCADVPALLLSTPDGNEGVSTLPADLMPAGYPGAVVVRARMHCMHAALP